MKSGLFRTVVLGVLPVIVSACAGGAPKGALTDTPRKDAEKLPYSEWRSLSENPRLSMRVRASDKSVDDEKEWNDGYATQVELKNEDERVVKFDLEATAAGGVQRCNQNAIMLVPPSKKESAAKTPCEVAPGETVRFVVLSKGKGDFVVNNIRAFPWIDIENLEFSEPKVLLDKPRVTLARRVSGINHKGDKTWPKGYLAQFQIVNSAPYEMDFAATLETTKVGEDGGLVNCDGTALKIPTGDATEMVKSEPCKVGNKETRTFSAVLATPDGFSFTEVRNRPPKGWYAFKDPAMSGVFWKAETGASQDTIVPDDDPSKQSVGYEVAVTFFNARTEPSFVSFVVVPNVGTPPTSMPDPTRQIGGGSVMLLGGEVKKIVRASVVNEWTLWAAPKVKKEKEKGA